MFEPTTTLAGRVAVIAGGTGAIGLASASAGSRGSARAACCCTGARAPPRPTPSPPRCPAKATRRSPPTSSTAPSLRAAAAVAERCGGSVHILVNSAGRTQPVPPADLDALTDELIDDIMAVNFRGVVATIRAFVPLLKDSGDGLVVNISSIAGFTGTGSNLAYVAAKAGIDVVGDALARALAPTVRVLTVSPGVVDSSFVPGRGADFNQKAAATMPLRRIGTPDDVAAAVEACTTTLRYGDRHPNRRRRRKASVNKTLITCAVTGNLTKPEQTPHLPVTPAQIADDCLGAAEAGAAAVHIHVRDPATGRPSMEVELYRDVVDRIRARDRELVVNLTTGPGGRFVPSDDNPRVAAPGSTLLPPLERVRHIELIRPDVCSLDLNPMNSGPDVVINTPKNVRRMAAAIRAAGVLPELEIFDSGDIHLARDLLEDGTLAGAGAVDVRHRRQVRLRRARRDAALRAQPAAGGRDLVGLRHRPLGVPDGGAGLAARRPRPRRSRGQHLPRPRRAGEEQRRARS